MRKVPRKIRQFFNKNNRGISVSIIFICLLILIAYAVAGQRHDQDQIDELRQNQLQISCLIDVDSDDKCDKSKQDLTSIAQDNVFLADRNIYYTKCSLKLFAEYTRTRRPIEFDRLTKCEYTIRGDGTFSQPFEPTGNPKRNPPRDPISPQSSTPESEAQPQSNNQSNPPEDEMNPLESLLDIVSSPFRNIL